VETCFAVGQVSFIGDGGRSPKTVCRAVFKPPQAARVKALVVNVAGKGGVTRQVCLMKTNVMNR